MSHSNLVPLRDRLSFTTDTNIIDILDDHASVIEKVLLSFENGNVGIGVLKKHLPRVVVSGMGTKEPKDVYFKRVHQTIGKELSHLVGNPDGGKINYELFRLPKSETFLVFYIAPSLEVDEDAISDTLDFIDEEMGNLDAQAKRKLTQSLLTLIVKVAVYETAQRFGALGCEFYNSELLLSPIVGGSKKKYVSALRPSFFLSDTNEFVLTLSSASYELDSTVGAGASVEIAGGALNYYMLHDGKKLGFAKKVKATKTKRNFYATDKHFGESKLLAYSFMGYVIDLKLAEMGIAYQPRKFQPSLEVDSFARFQSDYAERLNPIVMVDTANSLSREVDGYSRFVAELADLFNAVSVIGKKDYQSFIDSATTPHNFIFVSASKDEDGTIEYFNDALTSKLLQLGKSGSFPTFNTTLQAFDRQMKDKKEGVESSFDPYTEVKLELLLNSLSGRRPIHCYQGFNVTQSDVTDFLAALDTETKLASGEDIERKLATRLLSGASSTKAKVAKIKTELYLKQSIYSNSPIHFDSSCHELLNDGSYCIDFFKHTKEQDNNEFYHSKVCVEVADSTLVVTDVHVSRSVRDVVNQSSPYLAHVANLHNDSYFIHCVQTGETLTSYSGIRTPLSLGNSLRCLSTEWMNAQLDADLLKQFGRANGATKAGKESCVLPFYITAGRGKADELSDDSKQHHYLILEPKGNECLLFVTDANFPKAKIAKQILNKTILCWDSVGNPVSWDKSSLLQAYLAFHTYNVVKLNDTAKTTLLTKLASIALLN
ncbi:hypothetical protein QTV43_000396 [Vibrio vulnificus]|nr:hypothetical protein [Vibrio vulnificus]